ncbi:alpha/beta fold hydrolase [Streptomyces albipurpureus]|uniref:Alpha/beta hydrolase n=1 Tax=Streptomyces albipurpureus TaxID=2897419 RepID=A0ABT0UYL0_9ACTN|nr:alpha/beta hydrolase [Streptomyces sp. CWNU-1]MCM2393657.1 alpha/beta hydrolase [Streptomyces sp. CWNU-1]
MPQLTLDQGTVHYRDTGEGEPVLLLHGYLMGGRLWEPVVDRLAPDFRCITPDLPLGAHRTPMNPGADLSLPGIARLVADMVAALDLPRVTLVGNDLGTAIAQIVAARHPARIGRLVLTSGECFDNCPSPWFRSLPLTARVPGLLTLVFQALRLRAVRRTPFAYGLLTKGAVPHDLIDDWMGAYFADPGVRRDCVEFTRGFGPAALLDAAERLASFDRPTLLAFAREDRQFPYAHGERLAAIVPGARLATIPDSRTWVMLDQPDLTARLIGDFIRSTPAGAAPADVTPA